MIIARQEDVTTAVLEAFAKTPDPRLREILMALVRHLHGFIREVRLSEREFQEAVNYIVQIGKHTSDSHNEGVLMAGSLGVSALVCLLNNGDGGQTETDANMLGPFWRDDAPATPNGASIVRSPTPGPVLFVNGVVTDRAGRPVADAKVDVWQSSPEGLYENQDPSQAEMNLRGVFTTDEAGRFSFRSVKPAGYPIPIDGPVGDMLRAQGRHNFRPAHLHVMVNKPGLKTLISQVYVNDDPRLDSDVQFGVTRHLVGNYLRHEASEKAPAPDVTGEWYSLDHTFVMEPGEMRLPKPPIRSKALAAE
jgi:catechol 1,2-dioxygenase